MMVADAAVETDATATVKVAEVDPAAIVTETGTVTDTALLLSATEIPPDGAAAVNDTVQLSSPEVE